MLVVNYIKHQAKEELYHNVKNLKKMYGFKNSDIKHGELTSTGFQNEETIIKYQDFMSSMEHLAAHTFQEYLKFYRQVLNQQDYNGRNPIHYWNFRRNKSIMDVLNINFEEEDEFDEFIRHCQELASLEDPNVAKSLEPRKYFKSLKELKHFLAPEVYDTIYKEYLTERKLLIRDILNARDV